MSALVVSDLDDLVVEELEPIVAPEPVTIFFVCLGVGLAVGKWLRWGK